MRTKMTTSDAALLQIFHRGWQVYHFDESFPHCAPLSVRQRRKEDASKPTRKILYPPPPKKDNLYKPSTHCPRLASPGR
jgi:hypothetical protein